MTPTWLITGGAGFIGVNFVLQQRRAGTARIVNLDKLTYAGNPISLISLEQDEGHVFVQGDIGDRKLVSRLLAEHRPQAVVNFAAESHVDRSIVGAAGFVETNVAGTLNLLEEVRAHWSGLSPAEQRSFRFLHISTDEVYGNLGPADPPFNEHTQYAPNSPYAASKAASDHFVRAFHSTWGLPVLTTNCSNNYGPYQFPEKLIPLTISNALEGKELPIYGDGKQVRDWLYVEDHCEAIRTVLENGVPGETYNIGGEFQITNIEVVRIICRILDETVPDSPHRPHSSLIAYVTDRPGHDRRYAIDASKISSTVGWKPREDFSSGIEKTIGWYLSHRDWVDGVRSGSYREWMHTNYASRSKHPL